MSWKRRWRKEVEPSIDPESFDPALRQALDDFKGSIHAWSETAYQCPRTVRQTVMRRTWRVAAGWAMACVLLAGAGSAAVYERHEQAVQARIAAVRAAEQQRELAAERARAEEDLMAKVDSDVSREVPSAMEPLAALMSDDATQ